MHITTDLFGRIHCATRTLSSARADLQRKPLHQLEALCSDKFPAGWAQLNPDHANSRERIYTPQITTLTFLGQVLSPGSSCRESVRQVQGYYDLQANGPSVSPDTSPYCQARARLDQDRLVAIRRHLADRLEVHVPTDAVPWPRPIKVVDGTTFNLPDTPQNRALWPQSRDQHPQCGFPLVRMVGLFSLQSGACQEYAEGAYAVSEGALFRRLWPAFQHGDIALGDRLFDSYGNSAGLKQQGVDTLFRMNGNRPDDFRYGQVLGTYDRLCELSQRHSESPKKWRVESGYSSDVCGS